MDVIARRFHEAYERLAPEFGYETRRESAVPWEDVPEQNKALMIAVATEVVGGAVEISSKALRLAEALYRAVEFEAGDGQAIADEIKALHAGLPAEATGLGAVDLLRWALAYCPEVLPSMEGGEYANRYREAERLTGQ